MEEVRKYSGLFIIVPEQEDTIDEVKSSISAIITENSGKVEKDNMLGKKKLAYQINKKDFGIYYQVAFSSQPVDVPKMAKQFRINTSIMRALIDLV